MDLLNCFLSFVYSTARSKHSCAAPSEHDPVKRGGGRGRSVSGVFRREKEEGELGWRRGGEKGRRRGGGERRRWEGEKGRRKREKGRVGLTSDRRMNEQYEQTDVIGMSSILF